MSNAPAGNLHQILAAEARLSRLHRLFKTHFDVTEPSLILDPYLFLGNCISAYDINRLASLGIRYVLNVAIRDVEVCPYYASDVRSLTIDLRDDDRENILRTFDQAFAFIDDAKRAKSRVLVHCSHGQSRSPAIVIGYLMRTYNVSLEQCLIHVVKARPCVLPNDGFLKQLIVFDRFLVDRRRQREEAALAKLLSQTPTKEIPIQHHAPVAPQQGQPTASQCPPFEGPVQTTTPSVVRPSTSPESIHVVPIQIPSKQTHSNQIEPVPTKTSSATPKKHVQPLPEQLATATLQKPRTKSHVEVTSSSHTAPSKKRSSAMITNIVKQSPSQKSRPRSAYSDHIRTHPPPSYAQAWHALNHHPAYVRASNDSLRTKYITEIYDKATRRFIPTTA